MNISEILILLRNIAFGIECTAAVIGLYFLLNRKLKGSLKLFPVFLTYIFLNDIIGLNTRHLFPESNNLILYNISNMLTFIFLFFIYHQHTKNKTSKRLILYFILFYIISLFISGFYENYLNQLQSIPFLLGAFLLMTTIILYYSEFLKSEQTQELTKDLLFWISTGLLIYYVGRIPFRIVRDYYANQSDRSILFIINIILTIVMNSFFIIGFIISRKNNAA